MDIFEKLLELLPKLRLFVLPDLPWMSVGETQKFKLLCHSPTQGRFGQVLYYDVAGHPVNYQQVKLP